jgi:hypothetical protein
MRALAHVGYGFLDHGTGYGAQGSDQLGSAFLADPFIRRWRPPIEVDARLWHDLPSHSSMGVFASMG